MDYIYHILQHLRIACLLQMMASSLKYRIGPNGDFFYLMQLAALQTPSDLTSASVLKILCHFPERLKFVSNQNELKCPNASKFIPKSGRHQVRKIACKIEWDLSEIFLM